MKKSVARVILAGIMCFVSGVSFAVAEESECAGATPAWPAGLPVYDHVVIVVEENKDYHEVIENAWAPYLNSTLKAEGANFTKMFGEEHNSQGNYFWLFSGSNQSVGFKDEVPTTLFTVSNLGQQLIDKGKSFKGYSESLPAIGFAGNLSTDMLYARKHAPWVSFSNVPNGTTIASSSNLRFSDFPADFSKLPTVSFVIPNLDNDMHNGDSDMAVPKGDAWLKTNIDPYYQWAKAHNSLLIVTFDENNDRRHFKGLTNPTVIPTDEFRKDVQNRIATIFAGAHIKHGDFTEGDGVTHVNILRTLEAMYGLPKSGKQQPNAAGGGITDDFIITDVFK
ncbi:MAG: hypothetical protein JWM11_7084 [Planctomycetaceae bacterium]|nr:hypothetical protein [Planctomycetaceae bacterium]